MPRPKPREEARVWLQFAADDFRAACGLMAMSPPAIRQALVQGQQAAEKALKAFLTSNACAFRKTHSLEEIGEQCLAIDPSMRAVIDLAVPLGEYALKFRYPGGPSQLGPDEVAEALTNARGVLEAAVSRMP